MTAALAATAAACVSALAGTSRTPLVDTDEPRYAESARVMLESGDWLRPMFNGEPRHAKPAMMPWLIASSFAAFGVTEFAARLPSAVFGALVAVGLWLYGRRRLGEVGGAFAALAWATMPAVVVWSRAALTDNILTLWIAGAALALFEAARAARKLPAYALAGVFMGLGALTKGPVAIALPLLAWLVYGGRPTAWFREAIRGAWLAPVVAVAVAGPWFAVQLASYGTGYIEAFLGEEYIARFTAARPAQAARWMPLYYVPVVLGATFPWVAALPLAGRFRRASDGAAAADLARFATAWFVTTVAVFSLSRTQQPQYVHSAYPALALLAGAWLATDTAPTRRAPRRAAATLLAVGGVLLTGAVLALPRLIEADARRRTVAPGPGLSAVGWWTAGITAAAAAAVLFLFLTNRHRAFALAAAATGALIPLLVLYAVGPYVIAYRAEPLQAAGMRLREALPPEGRVYTYGHGVRSSALVYYSRHLTIEVPVGEGQSLVDRLRPGDAVVTRPDRLAEIPLAAGLSEDSRYGSWVIVLLPQ